MGSIFSNPDRILLLDGGLGTMLLRTSRQPSQPPFLMNLSQPEDVLAVHRAYVAAGSHILCTNTFGLGRRVLESAGRSAGQLVRAAVGIAREAADGRAQVALDMGPMGEMMQPLGTLRFDEAYEFFKEMAIAGQEAGAQLVAIETMADLTELRAAILAVRENTSLPVFATMTFEETGRTFLGVSPESFAMVAEGLGAAAVGVNCSLAPESLLPTVKKIAAITSLPLIVKPNAGRPDPDTGTYSLSAAGFAAQMEPFAELGVQVVGGCCGTDPSYIEALKRGLADSKPKRRRPDEAAMVCTATTALRLDDETAMGTSLLEERRAEFLRAASHGDLTAVMGMFSEETDGGAQLVCVPLAFASDAECASFVDILTQLQGFQPVPMAFVAENPAHLEAVLRAFQGKACVLAAADADMDALFDVIVKYGAVLMGMQA